MPDLPRLMTVAAAAEQLGCHPETIRRAIRTRQLACYRLNGCIRIAPEQLAAYLASNLQPAREFAAGECSSVVEEFGQRRRIARALSR